MKTINNKRPKDNYCEVYDMVELFIARRIDNYVNLLIAKDMSGVNGETFARSLMETNPGTIINVDFTARR